ncbi:uncharacterized protein LOC131319462 [Rhododendron vialii]|uniref:uncharacterized protein LOC131319462 n=1 Tax=Rhododendron vialii TaxID=182163 RepID=UPI00265D6AE6|nr:uncharacterized protein LOC131319462 [Rhododendron vialii]
METGNCTYDVTADYVVESWGSMHPWHNQAYIRHFKDRELFCRAWYSSTVYTHPSLLRSFCGHVSSSGRFSIVYERYTEDFRRYVREGIGRGEWLKKSTHYGLTHLMVHDDVKGLLRNLMGLLKYFHSKKRALNGFSLDNIVMCGDMPKLVGIIVYPSNDDRVEADFKAIDAIIDYIYQYKYIPIELRMLRDQLGNFRGNEDNIYDHPSLWGLGRRLVFLRNIWDWSSFVGALYQTYIEAFDGLELDWFGPNSGYTWQHRVPEDSPIQQCIDWKDDGEYSESIHCLARLLRNAVGHIGVYSDEGSEFTQEKLDDMISIVFPGFLVEIETRLFGVFGTTFFTL